MTTECDYFVFASDDPSEVICLAGLKGRAPDVAQARALADGLAERFVYIFPGAKGASEPEHGVAVAEAIRIDGHWLTPGDMVT